MARRRWPWPLLLFAITLAAGCRSEPPANPEALLSARSLGTSALERGRLTEAEAQFKKIVALAPTDPFGYANLGLTYLQAGRYADAQRELRRARELAPDDADVGRMLAKLYALTNRLADARATLEALARRDPRDAKVLYALASLDTSTSPVPTPEAERGLRQVLDAVPANLAVRLQLTDVFIKRGEADSAVRQLEEFRRLRPEPPAEARPLLAAAIQLLRAGQTTDAAPVFARFLRLMELTAPYQAALAEVKWFDAPIPGRPVLTFQPQSVIERRGTGILPSSASIHFVDVTAESGLPDSAPGATAVQATALGLPSVLATGDFTGDGTDDVLTSVWSPADRKFVTRLYAIGRFRSQDLTSQAGIALPAATDAAVGDFDNDGWLDVFLVGTDGRGALLRNTGGGKFENLTVRSGTAELHGARKAVFLDLDHDGDLDLMLVGGERNVVYRNNLDGTFSDETASMGLVGRSPASDVTFADFDDDGHLDVALASDAGIALFHNTGQRRFDDATAAIRRERGPRHARSDTSCEEV